MTGRSVLFVYGSLKRGRRNHRLLADQHYLGDAATAPHYRLIDLGTYPGLIRDDTAGVAVRGEVWAVSRCCLLELDDFEGEEGLYARAAVEVPGRPGAEAYFWTGPVPPDARLLAEW